MNIKDKAKHILAMIEADERGETLEYEYEPGKRVVSIGFKADGQTIFENPERYRIKPKPITRPWSAPEDVPPLCWIRGRKGASINDVQRLVMCVHDGAVTHAPGGAGHIATFKELAEKWEYSTDRKTWHPCTVTEEA